MHCEEEAKKSVFIILLKEGSFIPGFGLRIKFLIYDGIFHDLTLTSLLNIRP